MSSPFEGTGKMEYENGPFHDNICIGQYGVNTLRPERDIMKQTGSSDGWFADWLCKEWDWFNSSASDMSDCHSENNGNREYLDFTFPFLMEVKSIRLQGIREILTGGHALDKLANGAPVDGNIPPLGGIDISLGVYKTKLPLRSRIDTFEVWCNDGQKWLTVDSKTNKWKSAEDVVKFSKYHNEASDNEPFKDVHKFQTYLNNYYSIADIQVPCGQKCLEVRVVFNSYTGTALGTKIGIVVEDHDSRVCRI